MERKKKINKGRMKISKNKSFEKELKFQKPTKTTNFSLPQKEEHSMKLFSRISYHNYGYIPVNIFEVKKLEKKEESKGKQEKDYTKRDEAQRQYNQKMDNLCSELTNINNQISKHKEGNNSAKIKNELKKLERRIEEYEEQQRNNRDKFKQKLSEVNNANIKKIRNNIKYYVEDQSIVTKQAIDERLDENANRFVQAICSVVSDSIDGEAKRLKSELDNIIEVMNSQGNEREQMLANNAKSMEELKILLAKTLDLESEINKVMSDKLELDDSSEKSDFVVE